MWSRPPPSGFHSGKPNALPLMSQSATSIADSVIVKIPAGPEPPAAVLSFAATTSTRSGSSPIAGGELVYGIVPFRQMIEARSVDYVMIDLIRVGGITQWMKVAGMAEAFNLPVVSHVIPEIHTHLVAAVPNGLTVEYMGWMLKLFEGTAALDNGELVLSDRPGLGLSFNQQTINRFGVA